MKETAKYSGTRQQPKRHSTQLLLRLMQPMTPLINHIQNPRRLLIQMRRWRFGREASIRSYLHTLSTDIRIEEAGECIYHAFDWSEHAFFLHLVIEGGRRDGGAYDVGTDGIEGDRFLGKIFSVGAHEAYDAVFGGGVDGDRWVKVSQMHLLLEWMNVDSGGLLGTQ